MSIINSISYLFVLKDILLIAKNSKEQQLVKAMLPTRAVIWLLSISAGLQSASAILPNVNIMYIYSKSGVYSGFTGTTLEEMWVDLIKEKVATDPTWPFNVTLELFDGQSDCDLIDSVMSNRLNDTSLPPIVAIVAEGDFCGPGAQSARTATRFRIPIIMSVFNPDLSSNWTKMPPDQDMAFLMEGAAVRTQRETVDALTSVGAKTAIAVAYSSHMADNYDTHTCFGAADLLETRGIKILDTITIPFEAEWGDVRAIANDIKKKDPDVLLWCDYLTWYDDLRYEDLFIMKHLKEIDYTPNAVSILDCVDNGDYRDPGTA
jgi:hypothetical protein